MAYSKTNWVDNTTPIDKNNLNKIEQGIYDNSLVVDAVTNTLNPTDTETYKTAELTEGQITDVIGVNDILIKGQTSQDGTPTPSAPVDVNVVSGSNVVNIQNKNIAKMEYFKENYTIDGNGLPMSSGSQNRITNTVPINVRAFNNVVVSFENNTSHAISFIYSLLDAQNNLISRVAGNSSGLSINTSTAEYLYICFYDNVTLQSITEVQVEPNTTATTYEPHQGKELSLDLPVENLLNISNDINTTTSGITASLINTDTIDFNGVASSNYISTGTVNLTKPLESGKTYCFKVFENNDSNLRFRIWGYNSNNELKFNVINGNSLTLNANIVKYKLVLERLTTNNKYNVQAKFQVSEASYINTYTPYGTEPIELCKIGDYQDYFYKSGSKWYLHKGVNKITSYNGETITTSYISTTGELSTGAKVYYALATATNTEITNTTLISQLEAIYNAPLYEETNITQTNNDLPMVLDITACKDNINGIKAFIRK